MTSRHDCKTYLESWFDFENTLTQSEARELPTSGHNIMEGPTMVLIVFIALSYTYTMAKHQYLRKRVMHAFALWPYIVRQPARFRKSDYQTQSEAREPPTSGHKSVMEGPRILLIVFIALSYTYIQWQNINI